MPSPLRVQTHGPLVAALAAACLVAASHLAWAAPALAPSRGAEPGISGRNNLQTLAVCEMLVRSARERRPVERAELD